MKKKSLIIVCMLAIMAFLGAKTQVSNSLLKDNVLAFSTNDGDNNYGLSEYERYVYLSGDEKPNCVLTYYVANLGGHGPVWECASKGWGKGGSQGTCYEW